VQDKDVRTGLDWLLGGCQGKQSKVVQKNDKEEWSNHLIVEWVPDNLVW